MKLIITVDVEPVEGGATNTLPSEIANAVAAAIQSLDSVKSVGVGAAETR